MLVAATVPGYYVAHCNSRDHVSGRLWQGGGRFIGGLGLSLAKEPAGSGSGGVLSFVAGFDLRGALCFLRTLLSVGVVASL